MTSREQFNNKMHLLHTEAMHICKAFAENQQEITPTDKAILQDIVNAIQGILNEE